MENINQITLSGDSMVALLGIIVTIIISLIGAVYAIVTNTKKYELTENYRCEILEWYKAVTKTMVIIIHLCDEGEFYMEKNKSARQELLSELSVLAEVGRFYFPNVIKKDGFGSWKPTAYQGYRHINLEFILHFYNIASSPYTKNTINSLWKLERQFTSFVFDMIKPRKRNKIYTRYLNITIPEGKSIEDFIAENPEHINVFV